MDPNTPQQTEEPTTPAQEAPQPVVTTDPAPAAPAATEPFAQPVAPAATPEQKSFLVALLLSILVGTFGIDRFYLGYVGLGILKLITAGGCGVWWLIDVILIATGNLKAKDGTPLAH